MALAEGKCRVSGEILYDEEESEQLVAPCAAEWSDEKGADSIETSINAVDCDYVDSVSSLDNRDDEENQCSRSNMIISGGATKSKFNVYIATCAANLAAVAAGCVLTWSSPTIPKIIKQGEKVHVTIEEGAWLSSLVAVGASLGPFIASMVVNRIGRKWTILLDMLLFLISWSILAYFNSVYALYGARVLAGIAVGCVFTILPMYIAEIAPMDLRGMLGSLMQFFLCIGFLLSYIIGPYTSYLTLILCSAGVPILCILVFSWMPESPYYLLSKDRKEEALSSLQWLRGYPEPLTMQNEIADIHASAVEAKRNKGSLKALLSSRGDLKALYYACALAFFQQTSGINVVLFYAETIFEATGSSLSSSISTIVIGLVMTSAAGVTAPAAKIFGIKNLLCISAVGEAISLGALGLYFFLKDSNEDVSALGWLPVTSLVFFIITYSIGFGPFVWVIMAEIFPAHLKAIASAVTASFCWLLCFILTRFFSVFTDNFGKPAAFWMFGVFCVIALFFVLFQLPDTEGKTFQEIQQLIHGKKKREFSEQKV